MLHHHPGDLALLGASLVVVTLAGFYLVADFRETPSGFPWRDGEQSGDAPKPAPQRLIS